MWKPEEYCTLLNDALARNETAVIACLCSIRYSGRAESFLAEGDRIILIKSDSSLQVHQPSGNAPVNYMKPNSGHTMVVENGRLFLRSRNIALKDSMDIIIDRIYFFNAHKMEDGQSIVIQGTEEDMSNMLYQNPEMIEEGFRPASREEQTKYGFIDVFGTDKDGNAVIVECKRYCADLGAVTQLRRYVEKMMVSKGIKTVRGILAAPKITDNAKRMLEDWGFKFVSVRPPKYLEEFDKRQKRLDVFSDSILPEN